MATETKAKAAPQKAEKKTAAKTPSASPVAKPAVQAAASLADPRDGLQRRKIVTGTVVSDKMQKTIVVKVDRRVRHPLYMKYVVRSQRFKAHDEKNDAKMGDQVALVESRPLSRDKRWVLQSILRRAGQVAEANV